MKTTAVRTQDIEQKWYIMDCSGKTLGRLSVQVANILRGKNNQLDKDPDKIIRDSVKGMLPKNRLNRQIIKKLKVYSDENHPHEAQNPKELK